MKNTESIVLALCLCAGGVNSVAGAGESPTTLSPTRGTVVDVAHIYYNIATGERVVTLLGDGQTAPADAGASFPVWSSLVSNQCADFGHTTEWFFAFDNNAGTTSLATDITVLDFGDIATDTVVDCVHINWVTGHDDVDADSDGVGDGVVGLAGEWTYWDTDNGRAAQSCMRLPLISFMLVDLPGNIAGPDAMSSYSVDIDLVGSFSNSLTFEIGDSDGDLQGAAFGHNNIDYDSDGIPDGPIANGDRDFDGALDSDLDGDGLFDWAWSVRFAQPGTRDLDGDGVIDGDFADSMRSIGVSFGAGDGHAVEHGDGTWTWELDTAVPGATGQEDAFTIYTPPIGGEISRAGLFWFGGFECSSAPLPGPGYTPSASFEHALYGPVGICLTCCCPGDVNCDGVLNFFDISEFLTLFAAQDPQADFNNDGVWSFFDISAFLAAFSAGCP